ncbi:hypothetical protein MMC18_002477 [Xylographa bjoerkii]|nr:hypothetical protein [Xylographa bjoerkii]
MTKPDFSSTMSEPNNSGKPSTTTNFSRPFKQSAAGSSTTAAGSSSAQQANKAATLDNNKPEKKKLSTSQFLKGRLSAMNEDIDDGKASNAQGKN